MGSLTSPDGLFAAESLVHILNLHLPNDSTAVETGVFRAYNLIKILENCNKIKTMYGIDQYLPYTDYIEIPVNHVDEEKIARVKSAAYKEISLSEHKDKVVIIEKSSQDAVSQFKDESINFIFLDSYLTEKDVEKDLEIWYPKLVKGGIFAGHDWEQGNQVDVELNKFIVKHSIPKVSYYDMVWTFIKE
jgi:hypothetical protein